MSRQNAPGRLQESAGICFCGVGPSRPLSLEGCLPSRGSETSPCGLSLEDAEPSSPVSLLTVQKNGGLNLTGPRKALVRQILLSILVPLRPDHCLWVFCAEYCCLEGPLATVRGWRLARQDQRVSANHGFWVPKGRPRSALLQVSLSLNLPIC